MTDTPPSPDADPADDAELEETESALTEMHRSGVGTQDPNLVSGAETELVDDQVRPDAEPQV